MPWRRGASLAYVRDQMGHSSIQVSVRESDDLQEVLGDHWLGGRDSDPDTQIPSPSGSNESKEDQRPDSADHGEVRQNTQPRRNKKNKR